MSKITIVSRPDQHLLIDVSGCLSFKEAIEQLSAALLSANQFWQGTTVDLNLGKLLLTKVQLAQIIALTKGVGICAKQILADNPQTTLALKELEAILETAANELAATNKDESTYLSSLAVMPDNDEHLSDQPHSEYIQHITLDGSENKIDIQPDIKTSESVGSEMITCADSLANPTEQSIASSGKRQSLYIKQTLRAGQAVSHKGDLIIIGDVNAGAEVLAEGDITIWGSLRGIAHAGVGGNTKAEIRALRLQPIQIRIAHYIARSPDVVLTGNSILTASPFMAETAKLVDGKIRILRETFD